MCILNWEDTYFLCICKYKINHCYYEAHKLLACDMTIVKVKLVLWAFIKSLRMFSVVLHNLYLKNNVLFVTGFKLLCRLKFQIFLLDCLYIYFCMLKFFIEGQKGQ